MDVLNEKRCNSEGASTKTVTSFPCNQCIKYNPKLTAYAKNQCGINCGIKL